MKSRMLQPLSLRILFWTALVGAALMVPAPAFSQSCALCYTQAASAGARMIEALRSGILILVIPPTCLTAFAFIVLHRKSHQFKQADGSYDADRW